VVDLQFVFDGIGLDRQRAVGPVCAFEGRNLGGVEGLGVVIHRCVVEMFAGGTLSEVVGKLFLGHTDCLRHFGSVEDFLENFANSRQVDRDSFDVAVVGINSCSEPCEHELVPCRCVLDGLMGLAIGAGLDLFDSWPRSGDSSLDDVVHDPGLALESRVGSFGSDDQVGPRLTTGCDCLSGWRRRERSRIALR
jgi:hypothetical protein